MVVVCKNRILRPKWLTIGQVLQYRGRYCARRAALVKRRMISGLRPSSNGVGKGALVFCGRRWSDLLFIGRN